MGTELRPHPTSPLDGVAQNATLDRLAALDKPHRFIAVEMPRALELEAAVIDAVRVTLHGSACHFRGQYPLTTWIDILSGRRRAFSLLDLCRLIVHPTQEGGEVADAALRELALRRGHFLADIGADVAFLERQK